MSAAEALKAARAAGIHLEVDGDDLATGGIRAAAQRRAGATVAAQSRDRSCCCDPVATAGRPRTGGLLRRTGGNYRVRRRAAARARPRLRRFACCVVEWLNRNPIPSAPGRCAWCGQAESRDAVVLPYGTEPGTHIWLHAECWPAWQKVRRSQATEALMRMGVGTHDCVEAAPAVIRQTSASSSEGTCND